eukprot:473167-Prorocentrum_minimum.AAC.1
MQVARRGEIPMSASTSHLVHDCAMSGRYLVFCIDAWTLEGGDLAQVSPCFGAGERGSRGGL